MTDQEEKPSIPRILRSMAGDPDSQRQQVGAGVLDPELALLRTWQAQRLLHTYADLLAVPRYTRACQFFLTDIYSAQDFRQRDQDFEQLYELLKRYIPAPMLHLLADTLELNRLTAALDDTLLRALLARLGTLADLTEAQYTQGYRDCDNYAVRVSQIDLLVKVLQEVGELARQPLVGPVLKLASLPAHRAGWVEVHDFLMRAHQAFRQMNGAGEFAKAVEVRERTILDKIYAGESTFLDTDWSNT